MSHITRSALDSAFSAYTTACEAGQLGAALIASDVLCQATVGAAHDYLPLPTAYAAMSTYSAGMLQAISDRIAQYNHTVDMG